MITKTQTVNVVAPSGEFPLRHLESYVQRCLAQYADQPGMTNLELSNLENERKTMMTRIVGDTLVTTIQHTLSPLEEITERLVDAELRVAAVLALLPREGEKASAEVVTRIRKALGGFVGGPPTGTPSADIALT